MKSFALIAVFGVAVSAQQDVRFLQDDAAAITTTSFDPTTTTMPDVTTTTTQPDEAGNTMADGSTMEPMFTPEQIEKNAKNIQLLQDMVTAFCDAQKKINEAAG